MGRIQQGGNNGMSDVNDRYIIDRMVIEDGKLVLIIADSMQWG